MPTQRAGFQLIRHDWNYPVFGIIFKDIFALGCNKSLANSERLVENDKNGPKDTHYLKPVEAGQQLHTLRI